MKLIHTEAREATFKRGTASKPQAGRLSFKRAGGALWGRVLPVFSLAMAAGLAFAGTAMAAGAASKAGTLGAQLDTMSSEATNAGSLAFAMACYIGAALCFGFGVWALWQSRQPQNRESGHIGRGIAGLVLCGLFATAGVWINKASITASGGNATINTTPKMVQFGSGG